MENGMFLGRRRKPAVPTILALQRASPKVNESEVDLIEGMDEDLPNQVEVLEVQ
jgi:hypothetical protein